MQTLFTWSPKTALPTRVNKKNDEKTICKISLENSNFPDYKSRAEVMFGQISLHRQTATRTGGRVVEGTSLEN